jgi:hypothetical protein
MASFLSSKENLS